MDFNNSGYPEVCYADSVMEFPDILLSVPPESLSKFLCSAVSGKLATAAKRLTTGNECRAGKLMMVFSATYYLLSAPQCCPQQHYAIRNRYVQVIDRHRRNRRQTDIFSLFCKPPFGI